MINVVHILSAIDGGGGERVVYNYYEHVDRTKVRFTVVAIDKGRKQLLEDGFKEMGANVIYVPKGIMARLSAVNQILKQEHYDVIHCHRIFLAELYMFLGWLNNVPIRIAHAHMAFIKGHLKGRLLNRMLKPLLKLMTTNRLACGKAAGKYVWGSLKKVTVLNNAIDLQKFAPNEEIRDEYRKNLGLSKQDIVIGHVGRFNEQKNHVFLVQIFEKLCNLHPGKNFYLVMIGVGETQQQIQSITKKSKYCNRYIYLNLQPDVHNWMQSFDVFLLPSLFEGLPVVGVEAQASGLPCVFSSAITNEFKMGKHVHFLSLEDSVENWANCVYDFCCLGKKDDNRETIIKEGFDIDCEAKKLEHIYMGNK